MGMGVVVIAGVVLSIPVDFWKEVMFSDFDCALFYWIDSYATYLSNHIVDDRMEEVAWNVAKGLHYPSNLLHSDQDTVDRQLRELIRGYTVGGSQLTELRWWSKLDGIGEEKEDKDERRSIRSRLQQALSSQIFLEFDSVIAYHMIRLRYHEGAFTNMITTNTFIRVASMCLNDNDMEGYRAMEDWMEFAYIHTPIQTEDARREIAMQRLATLVRVADMYSNDDLKVVAILRDFFQPVVSTLPTTMDLSKKP
jgi:hypothetical protein